MNIKTGDILTCKKTIDDKIIKNKKYKVDFILVHSTLNTTLPYEYWVKRNNNTVDEIDYLKEFFFSTIIMSNKDGKFKSGLYFSSFDIFDYFYTKKEERRIKLLEL